MSEPEISGQIVPAPPVADIRYEDPDAVAGVFVRVKWKNGRILEYQAREPEDFEMNEPESLSSMLLRDTGVRSLRRRPVRPG